MFKLAAYATFLLAFAGAANAAAKPFTAATAPDALTRAVLAHPLQRIDERASSAVDPRQAIHANFTQIIEQNFARLDARSASRLVDNLSDRELADLAQLYVNAAADTGRPARLLDLLATRLDGAHLGRLSRSFGYADVDAAVQRAAPAKAFAFSQSSSPTFTAPVAGAMLAAAIGPAATGAAQPMATSTGPYLNMTPNEIYLDFRTAPVGALGVSGALFETGITMYGALYWAYEGGYYVGTQFANLVQTYDWPLWLQISNLIGGAMAPITNALTPQALGTAQKGAVGIYQVTPMQYNDYGSFDGDYDNTEDWTEFDSGGSGSCHIDCSTHSAQ